MNRETAAVVVAVAVVLTAAVIYKIHLDNIERERAERRNRHLKEGLALAATLALAL